MRCCREALPQLRRGRRMSESNQANEHTLESIREYNDQFVPIKDTDYQWDYEHAVRCFESAREAQVSVWNKADRGVGYASAVVSILVLAMIELRGPNLMLPYIVLWVGMLLAASSGIAALLAAKPRRRAGLPDVIT